MLAFECLNFTLGGSLIRGLVRKLAIRHPQKQCKNFTLGGSLIPSFCQTRPINSETEDFVRQAVDGLGGGMLPLDTLWKGITITFWWVNYNARLLDIIVCFQYPSSHFGK
jgi:hypothetical protein